MKLPAWLVWLVLGCIGMGVVIWWNQRPSPSIAQSAPQALGLPTGTDLTQIDIATAGATLTIMRGDQGWKADMFLANMESVNQILRLAHDDTLVDLVSTGGIDPERFGLSPGEKITLTLDGTEYEVGKSTGTGRYIRKAGEDTVFEVPLTLPEPVTDADVWIDTDIVRMPTSTIRELSFQSPASLESFSVRSENGSFVSVENPEVLIDQEKITQATERLSGLDSVQVLGKDRLESWDELTGLFVLTITPLEGVPVRLEFYRYTEDQVLVVHSGKIEQFVVDLVDVDDLFLTRDDVIAPSLDES